MYAYVYVCVLVAQSCLTCNPMGSRLFCLWNYPGKKTQVSSHSLLHGIFSTQEPNLGPALQADPLLSEPPGKPIIYVYIYMYIYIKPLRAQGMQNLNQ